MLSSRKARWFGVAAVVLVLAVAGGLWLGATPLHTWYTLRGLAGADDGNRAAWVEAVVRLEGATVPGLLAGLERDDAAVVANLEAALAALAEHWGPGEGRRRDLAAGLARAFPRLSLPGQRAALRLEVAWLRATPDELKDAFGGLLATAARVADKEVRGLTLELALLAPPDGQPVNVCRELARLHLKDGDAANRVRAVQLAQRAGPELLQQVLPLLQDPAPDVRRAAMLAVGHVKEPASEVVAAEDLFGWLHDPDADVRRVCEAALRVRGLDDDHLKLARLISDGRPATRLQVLACLRYEPEQEPWYWLRRLSHDPAPEVRVAAIRAAAEQSLVDLTDRTDQMAQTDPNPTVRQLARYYLSCPKPRPAAKPAP